MDDLVRAGCRNVQYLPFGFDPDLFYPEMPSTPEEKCQFAADVVFAGGADRDRVDYIFALIRAGMKVNLYGSYWERYPETKAHTRGQADVRTLRLAISSAKIALCLVRRANRDGNCMRTFEVPAVGTCMLTEDTQEHREIFGEEGEAVVYFKTIPEMVEKTHWLLNHDDERRRLAKNAYVLITQGANTYRDRLKTMLHET
jgi:spore maturation protein CgeB